MPRSPFKTRLMDLATETWTDLSAAAGLVALE
jgi:hypothetical protein